MGRPLSADPLGLQMRAQPVRARRAAFLTAIAGVLVMPTAAVANFVWPPALYYYSFTRWWVVVGGLALEALVYAIWLRPSFRKAVTTSLAANAASAAIGFVALWPLLFYEPGISLALRLPGAVAVIAIAILIIIVNVAVEYWVATRWCTLPRTRAALGNVAVANVLSFLLVLSLLPTWFRL
jgi:hypothetical protein